MPASFHSRKKTLQHHNPVISCTEAESVKTLFLLDTELPGTFMTPKDGGPKREPKGVGPNSEGGPTGSEGETRYSLKILA